MISRALRSHLTKLSTSGTVTESAKKVAARGVTSQQCVTLRLLSILLCSALHCGNARDKPRLGYSSSDDDAPRHQEEPLPDPPRPLLAVSAMGIGAFFAVGIAAVGITGSFYLAAWATANSTMLETAGSVRQKVKIDSKAEKEALKYVKDTFGWEVDDSKSKKK